MDLHQPMPLPWTPRLRVPTSQAPGTSAALHAPSKEEEGVEEGLSMLSGPCMAPLVSILLTCDVPGLVLSVSLTWL